MQSRQLRHRQTSGPRRVPEQAPGPGRGVPFWISRDCWSVSQLLFPKASRPPASPPRAWLSLLFAPAVRHDRGHQQLPSFPLSVFRRGPGGSCLGTGRASSRVSDLVAALRAAREGTSHHASLQTRSALLPVEPGLPASGTASGGQSGLSSRRRGQGQSGRHGACSSRRDSGGLSGGSAPWRPQASSWFPELLIVFLVFFLEIKFGGFLFRHHITNFELH